MIQRLAYALMVVTSVSCASRQPGAAPTTNGAGAFAYTLQDTTTVAYESADTTLVVMEASGMSIQIDAVSKMGVDLDLSPASDGVRGTVRMSTLEGTITNSMGPAFSVGANDIPGPAEVTVTPRGVVDVVQAPELGQNLQRVISTGDLYRRYFMRMPARRVARGEAWTDTVSITDETLGLTSETTTIVTSTYARDTTVAGRRLNVITSTMSSGTRVTGSSEGVQLEQNLSGEGTATTLWDPIRRVIFERRESGTASGTTDLPAMGISGLPTNVRATQTLRLRG